MRNMSQNLSCGENVYNLWCFNAYCAVLLQNRLILRFTLFCRKICFVAIYALLRGEKLSKKLCPWRKKDKYDVCLQQFHGRSQAIHMTDIPLGTTRQFVSNATSANRLNTHTYSTKSHVRDSTSLGMHDALFFFHQTRYKIFQFHIH